MNESDSKDTNEKTPKIKQIFQSLYLQILFMINYGSPSPSKLNVNLQ